MKLTKGDIDKVRDIEGFPITSDEDIIALSNPPYYTACPNPFIEDFIKKNGKLYEESTDDYYREPFIADISEGKNDPIYKAHSYHTKVPHKAIMRYILHYTNPGDIILDGFCGTGMTGIAAQMCKKPDNKFKFIIEQEMPYVKWGARKAILNDLSPSAAFIASNYNASINSENFCSEVNRVLKECEDIYGWMYETSHIPQTAPKNQELQLSINDNSTYKGCINYTIWSDVFLCPNCGEEIIYWDMAIDTDEGQIREVMKCNHCGVEITKSKCIRAQDIFFDKVLGKNIVMAKQVPVLINYTFNGKRYEKHPDEEDIKKIQKINNFNKSSNWYPTNELPSGEKTNDPIKMGITHVNLFYTRRNLEIIVALWEMSSTSKFQNQIKFCITSILIKTASKLHNIGIKKGNINLAGAMPNALYIPSMLAERNIFELLKGKLSDILPVYNFEKNNDNYAISTGSSTDLKIIKDNTIDYIFVDPPFGNNLIYSELSFIWDSWLKIITNNDKEAIICKTQNKGINEYQQLFEKCFSEFYRCLKPNRWITIEFHNSKNSVWMSINEAIQKAGFIVSCVKTLDKGQGSYNQQTAFGAVKQDLVISAYKPKESFKREFMIHVGSEETVWDFVRQHLEKLSVVLKKGDKIEIIVERQAFLLFDRMVAYHIINGIPVPIDATDFYRGLDNKFLKRDGMYFLHDQVNNYDTVRIMSDVEDIQFSLMVTDEKSAISWLYQQLEKPKTYAEIMPKFMQEIRMIEKYEKLPELSVLLEDNFIQNDEGKWYIPDVTKSSDVIKLREKKLLKEFEEYLNSTGKLKLFRTEAIRVGFSKLWKDKNYDLIVKIAERLPESVIQEDDKLLMYYDISLSRL